MNVLMKEERKEDISLLLSQHLELLPNKLKLGFFITNCYGLKMISSHQFMCLIPQYLSVGSSVLVEPQDVYRLQEQSSHEYIHTFS